MTGTFEIALWGSDDYYLWRLRDAQGEVVTSSDDLHRTKASAYANAQAVQRAATMAHIVDVNGSPATSRARRRGRPD